MVHIGEAQRHRIFPVERRGGALVVRPKGDATGFGHAELKAERDRVIALLGSGEFPNLIIDMEDANYFGSEMIGIFSRMISTVRDRGGKHAVVNISSDMREGIAIMKLDQVWNLRDARPAYRELGHESIGAKLKRNAKPILLVLAAMILVGGAAYAIASIPRDGDKRDYYAVWEIWEEYRIKRQLGRDFELRTWKEQAREEITPLIARLEARASPDRPAVEHLLVAARDHLPKILDPYLRDPGDKYIEGFFEEMRLAHEILEKRYRRLPEPNPLDPPEDNDDEADPRDSHGDPGPHGAHDGENPHDASNGHGSSEADDSHGAHGAHGAPPAGHNAHGASGHGAEPKGRDAGHGADTPSGHDPEPSPETDTGKPTPNPVKPDPNSKDDSDGSAAKSDPKSDSTPSDNDTPSDPVPDDPRDDSPSPTTTTPAPNDP